MHDRKGEAIPATRPGGLRRNLEQSWRRGSPRHGFSYPFQWAMVYGTKHGDMQAPPPPRNLLCVWDTHPMIYSSSGGMGISRGS